MQKNIPRAKKSQTRQCTFRDFVRGKSIQHQTAPEVCACAAMLRNVWLIKIECSASLL